MCGFWQFLSYFYLCVNNNSYKIPLEHPYNIQWKIFPLEFPQLRLTELIENSVGLPATTSKGNTTSQNTCLSATLFQL